MARLENWSSSENCCDLYCEVLEAGRIADIKDIDKLEFVFLLKELL